MLFRSQDDEEKVKFRVMEQTRRAGSRKREFTMKNKAGSMNVEEEWKKRDLFSRFMLQESRVFLGTLVASAFRKIFPVLGKKSATDSSGVLPILCEDKHSQEGGKALLNTPGQQFIKIQKELANKGSARNVSSQPSDIEALVR